jgi:hypothetical protein
MFKSTIKIINIIFLTKFYKIQKLFQINILSFKNNVNKLYQIYQINIINIKNSISNY